MRDLIKRGMLAALLAVGLAVAGCAGGLGGGSTTPAQAVFTVKTGYATALTAAVAYKRLPSCATAKAPCSDPAVVAQLQKADTAASTALDAAETVVRTPGFGTNVINSALTAANSALAAFTAITAQIGK